jgi:hypothetical protein
VQAQYVAGGGDTDTDALDRMRHMTDFGQVRNTARMTGGGGVFGINPTMVFVAVAALAALLILRK